MNGPRKTCNGDTILHIAFKNDERELLKWLCTVRNLDLNVENGEGKTGSSLAEELGKGAMYTFYFVLK